MDRQGYVVQAGAALTRLFPELTGGVHLADIFQVAACVCSDVWRRERKGPRQRRT